MDIQPKNNKLSIPLQLIEQAYSTGLTKPLQVFVFLKFYTDGKVHEKSDLFRFAQKELGIKDKRTMRKYLKLLIEIKWLIYNPKSGNYFIIGFDNLRKSNHFEKRGAACCSIRNIKKLDSFFDSAIMTKSINTQKFLDVNKSQKWAATNKSNVAFKPTWREVEEKRKYYGLSNSTIAKLLGCKQTRACQLKQRAVKNGFIKVKHRFHLLAKLSKPDRHMREQLYSVYPKLKGRIIFKAYKNGQVLVLEQLYDEITPNVKLISLKKFTSIKNAA